MVQVHLTLSNHTDRKMGPFEIYLSQVDSREEKVVMLNGLHTLVGDLFSRFSFRIKKNSNFAELELFRFLSFFF